MSACGRSSAQTELAQLRRWKREALAVLNGWERVWVALGEPGQLGEARYAAALAEVERLKAKP